MCADSSDAVTGDISEIIIAAQLIHVLHTLIVIFLVSLPITSFLISICSASEMPFLDTFDSYRGMINTKMDSGLDFLKSDEA